MASNGNALSEKVLDWAREHGNEFRGGDLEVIGITSVGSGPVLSAMARRGELTVTHRGNKRFYQAAPVEEQDVDDLADPEFIPNLKQSLADRLAVLHEERSKLDAQAQAIDDEAVRIRAAFGVLKD